jgi:transposase-like protein
VYIADFLKTKSHPATEKAKKVIEIAEQNRNLKRESRIIKSYIQYYENLFPWLIDYRNENLEDLLRAPPKNDDTEDPVLRFVPFSEYEILSEEERNQKALNRYLKSRKTPWQI